MHAQPFPIHQQSSIGYYGQDPRQNQDLVSSEKQDTRHPEKQDAPLLLENTPSMDFVTQRTREREGHIRTPSPSKRRFT